MVEAMRAAGSVDPWQLRRECPVAFAAFLAEAFRADTRLIALHFDVNEKTARNWLSGTHGPHGDKMLVAMRSHPDVFAKHLLRVA